MLKVKQINDEIIVPVEIKKIDPDKILGYNLFPDLSCNIFLCAKKKSGKTNVINKIINSCANKKTAVIIFCPTIYKDDTWKALIKQLKKNKIEVLTYTSIYDDDTTNIIKTSKKMVNVLQSLIDEILQDNPVDFDEDESQKKQPVCLKFEEDPKEIKERKSGIQSPDYIFIFDDISQELKERSIPRLLKLHRHFKSKIIISSQWWTDLEKSARGQLDYVLVFKDIPDEKLQIIYDETALNTGYELFYKVYKYATYDKFSFLYIDVRNSVFRKNFNTLLEIE